MILLKLTTNFCLHRFSRLLLRKMFANCCRKKIRQDSRWMKPTKLFSRSTELNKTSASPQRSTCMRSRISRPRRQWPWTPMWRHFGHNAHRNNSSVNSKAATEEIVPEDKATTGATATDHLRIKATRFQKR